MSSYQKVLAKVLQKVLQYFFKKVSLKVLQYFCEQSIGIGIAILLESIVNNPVKKKILEKMRQN
jgi:hypothetical protein